MIRMIDIYRVVFFTSLFLFNQVSFAAERPLYYPEAVGSFGISKAKTKNLAIKVKKEKKVHGREMGHEVDINRASVDEIDSGLVGVGSSKAKSIVDYREKHGRFNRISDLKNVKGIGDSILEKNKEWIKI